VKKMVRCKACGYIMAEEKLGDKCPACGVPSRMFEPYNDPMSESRRRILSFDLHPVAAHFVVSFAVAILVFLIATYFFRGLAQGFLISTVKVMAMLLPVLVLVGFLLGLLDGHTRFRRLDRSQILKKKMIYGSIFFVFAVGLAVFLWLIGIGSVPLTSIAVVLSAVTVGCTVMLAILGVQILNASLPG
jgi:small-conductance mechanosensitive channel/rubredoxin